MTIIAYYGKIKKLRDELQNLKNFSICSCGALSSRTCNFLKKLQELEVEDQLIQFLLSLNNGFDTAISNILSMDPMHTINHAFSIAQQIEKQKEVSANTVEFTGESSAMAAQRMNRNVYQQKNYFKELFQFFQSA